jgi:uncharacterized membrane protein YdjX (TVP38/TMEM64 family)
MMQWLSALLLRLGALGPLGVLLFVLLYVVSTVTMAPSFLLTVAAGAIYGVWAGSLLVFVAASLGASVAFVIARALAGSRLLEWLDRDTRVRSVRLAVAHEGAWVQFLLRLSPVVPFVLLNYALGLARVRYRDFTLAMFGMIPAILMYTYYGKVVGDVALLAAGVAPPRGTGYYVLLALGMIATIVATTLITRAARQAVDEQRQRHPPAT